VAGLIIGQVGAGAVFALNAASFVVFALVLLFLRRPAAAVEGTPERFASAMRAGRRYVRHSPAVRRMLQRVGLFVLPGAALWALLPLVASRLLGTGPTGYGVLLAALGAGAMFGADLLPRFGGRLSPNRLLLVAGGPTGCAPARAAASCTRTGRTRPGSSRSRSTPHGGNTCATTPAG
jgi:hypothetical protein